MSSEYYTLEKTSEVLGLATADVTRMRERGELRAFRDGSSWKFRKVDVDNRLAQAIRERSTKTADAADDSAAEAAFTAAGGIGAIDFDDALDAAGDQLALSLDTAPSIAKPAAPKPTPAATPAEDDFALDDDLKVADDGLALGDGDKTMAWDGTSDDDLTLATAQDDDADILEVDLDSHDDDDDSRVSASASDDISSEQLGSSGLDLDDEDSFLAFIADDDVALSDVPLTTAKKSEAAAVKATADDDFDLGLDSAPMEESESASQVIAVDDSAMDKFGFSGAGGASGAEAAGGSDMFATPEASGDSTASPVFSGASGSLGDYITPSAAALAVSRPEPQFSGMAIYLGLVPCLAIVMLAGMMTLDLIRFMWSWGQPNTVSSAMLNALASLLWMV